MVKKEIWEKPIRDFLDLHRKTQEIQRANILGKSFEVFPGVFSPRYASDTEWFARQILPTVNSKRFLEIGAGVGVAACLASLHGAAYTVATDINSQAILNIKRNAKNLQAEVDVRLGSVFEPIQSGERFDIIFWNHPFYHLEGDEELDEIGLSVFDKDYSSLSSFIKEGKNYLTPSGYLLLGTSNVARIRLIQKMAREAGYHSTLISRKKVPVFQGKNQQMDIRTYMLKPHRLF